MFVVQREANFAGITTFRKTQFIDQYPSPETDIAEFARYVVPAQVLGNVVNLLEVLDSIIPVADPVRLRYPIWPFVPSIAIQ